MHAHAHVSKLLWDRIISISGTASPPGYFYTLLVIVFSDIKVIMAEKSSGKRNWYFL